MIATREKIALPRISKEINEIRSILFGYMEKVQDELVAQSYLPFRLNLNKGVVRGIIEIFAWGLWQVYTLLSMLLAQTAPYYATGAWLDVHADAVNIKRRSATKAIGMLRLFRDAHYTGNILIPSGRIFRTLPDGKGEIYRYSNKESAVLPLESEYVDISIESESYGASANASTGQICELVTPINGIASISNQINWLTSEGADEESDEELAHRYSLAWAANNGCTKYAYEAWALAVPGVRSVSILDKHPRGQGTVDIVVRGADVLPTESLLEKVREAIAPHTPINDDWLVKAPVGIPIRIQGIIECIQADPFEIKKLAENRLRSLFAETSTLEGVTSLKIGQDVILDLLTHTVLSIQGVKSVQWQQPIENLLVLPDSVARLEYLNIEVIEAEEI